MKRIIKKTALALFLLLSGIISAPNLWAQATIGSDRKPERAAILDMQTDTDINGGLLLPRVMLNDVATLEPFISVSDEKWINNDKTRIKERHVGLTVYNLKSDDILQPGVYVWDGNVWQPTNAAVPEAGNGLSKSGDTLLLGGSVRRPVGIGLGGNDFRLRGNDTLYVSSPVQASGSWTYPVGNFAKGKFLTSDSLGNAGWEDMAKLPATPYAILNPDGVSVNIRSTVKWNNTKAYIEIPPGRWFVAVTMQTDISGSNIQATDWFWITSSFIRDGEAEPNPQYYEGSDLISGRALKGNSIISGYVVLKNTTHIPIRFYYNVARVEIGSASTTVQGTLNRFGRAGARENAIIAFALTE